MPRNLITILALLLALGASSCATDSVLKAVPAGSSEDAGTEHDTDHDTGADDPTTADAAPTPDTSGVDAPPDAAPADRDLDGVPDPDDRCPDVPDTAQLDSDGDGLGDACDEDDDGDGRPDLDDPYPLQPARCGDGAVDPQLHERCDEDTAFCVDCARVPVSVAPREGVELSPLGSAWSVPGDDLLLYRGRDENLYLASYAPEVPLRLVGHDLTHFPGHSLRDVAVTLDGTRVTYTTRAQLADQSRLYAVPLDTGEPELLSPPDLDVLGIARNPRSDQLIFWGAVDTDGPVVLLSRDASVATPTRPLTPTTLNAQPFSLCVVRCGDGATPRFTPDGQYIVFRGERGVAPNTSRHLYAVHADGGTPIELHRDANVPYRILDDGRHIVVAGPPPRRIALADGASGLLPTPIPVGDAAPSLLDTWRFDDGHVLAWASFDADLAPSLHTFTLSDPTPVRVFSRPDAERIDPIALSPDGRRALFVVRLHDTAELWTAPLDGAGAPRRIDGDTAVAEARRVDDLILFTARTSAGDGTHVFLNTFEGDDLRDLSLQANPSFVLDPTVPQDTLRSSPDGRRLRIIGRTLADDERTIYVLDLDTTEIQHVPQSSPEQTPFYDAGHFTPDGHTVLTLTQDPALRLNWNAWRLEP